MTSEQDYVDYFFEKYEGRVAIGVGYDQNLSEIYPFVFEDLAGRSIGIVALSVYAHERVSGVHIYHIASFKDKRGSGSEILKELCLQADKHKIILSLSPLFMPNGKSVPMSEKRLREWYGRFGFRGSSHFKRIPGKL
jgi:hypothetical protein